MTAIDGLSTRDHRLADATARRNAGVLWVDYDDLNAVGPCYYVTLTYSPPIAGAHCLADLRSQKGLS